MEGGSAFQRIVADAVVGYMASSDMARKAAELDALYEYLHGMNSMNFSYVERCQLCGMIKTKTDAKRLKQCGICSRQCETCESIYCKVLIAAAPGDECSKCANEPRCWKCKLVHGECDICGIELCIRCFQISSMTLGTGCTTKVCTFECLASATKKSKIE